MKAHYHHFDELKMVSKNSYKLLQLNNITFTIIEKSSALNVVGKLWHFSYTAVPLHVSILIETRKLTERKNTLDPVSRTKLKLWK